MTSAELEALINDLENEHEQDSDIVVNQLVPLMYDLRRHEREVVRIEWEEIRADVRNSNTQEELERVFNSHDFRKLHTILKLKRRMRCQQ